MGAGDSGSLQTQEEGVGVMMEIVPLRTQEVGVVLVVGESRMEEVYLHLVTWAPVGLGARVVGVLLQSQSQRIITENKNDYNVPFEGSGGGPSGNGISSSSSTS